MDGYSRVFDTAIKEYNKVIDKESLYTSFRKQYNIYGFIDNGDYPPDMEADKIAREINIKMYFEYKASLRYRKECGYGNSKPIYGDYNNLDSRHIMMFVIIFSNIKEDIKSDVEIGGGFGNWLTLNQHIPNWSIIDLPHVLGLQKWWLTQQDIDSSRYTFISAFDYDNWAKQHLSHDLVIGSHSLSEVSLDIFESYFHKVISKSKYFFYAYHNTRPTPQLIAAKLSIIQTRFNLIINVQSENKNVSNCVFVCKNV